ncbi:MAG: RNB domain-containing ribonuclease [Deltaproteobacteria bacterium]|nr:RNB domain-containing ribonuclease [Deltaproteobacteria bacterium]
MQQGKIIEYIERGDFNIALCMQDEVTRLHLLTPTNREVNLPPKRALLVSKTALNTQAPRAQLLQNLKRKEEVRNRLKDTVDVKEIWELVRDEQESFDHEYLAQLCFGDGITDDHVSALVRALFEDKIHFKMKEDRFFPVSCERVDQILKQREEEALREKKLAEGTAWLKRVLDNHQGEAPLCKEEIVQSLVELALYDEEGPGAKFGKELLQRAGGYSIAEARQILVKLGIWGEDENLDILRFEIPTNFSEEAFLEAERIRGVVEFGPEERQDLRYLSPFTIDGPLTGDFDDALSIEMQDGEIHLGIHIADVATLVPARSRLDEDAFQRGSSIYLPCRQIPMFPPALSHDTLSLKEGCDRWAVSLLSRLDMQGNLIDFKFVPSLIRVKKRYTYEEVNEHHIHEERFQTMLRLSHSLRQRRVEAGALLLSLPELALTINEGGIISVEKIDQDSPSRMVVAECMILYNQLAGRFARDQRFPCLYRSQEGPTEIIPAEGLDYVYYVFKQRRKLTPLTISAEPKIHSGLGVDVYTQASSPIRRYFDLLVQRQLRSFIVSGTPCYGSEELEQKRIALETTLRDVEKMNRNRTRYWLYKYLLQHVGEKLPALVLSVIRNRSRLLLTDLLLVVEMKKENGQELAEGQKIQVKIRKSDPWEDVLKVEYAGNL